jgi:DNA-binding XRE family transcriptional regulator
MVIEEIGKVLWGDRWQSEMARALGVHRDTVQAWAKRHYEFRPDVSRKLRALLSERRTELAELEDRLFKRKEASVSCLVCGERASKHQSSFGGSLYECRTHGFFGVSGSAEACGFWRQDERVRSEAYKRAKQRAAGNKPTRADPRPAILITTYDF